MAAIDVTLGNDDVAVTVDPDGVSVDVLTTYTDEQAQDATAALLTAGTNVSLTSDDAANTLTVSATDTDTNTQLSDEQVQDIVGAFVTGADATTVAYDDASNTLTISSTDTDTQRTDEQIQDVVGGFITGSGGTTTTYDDTNNTLTIESATEPKAVGGLVNGDHPDFATAQDAIDYTATNNLSRVIFGKKTYGPITIADGMRVMGAGPGDPNVPTTKFFGTDTQPAITSDGHGVVIDGVRAETPQTGTADAIVVNGYYSHVLQSTVGGAGGDGLLITFAQNNVTGVSTITGPINGVDCRITGDNNAVFANVGMNVVDEGTGNYVAGNT